MIIRLIFNRDGALSHGEIVDASGKVTGRFANWADLVPMIRTRLGIDTKGQRRT